MKNGVKNGKKTQFTSRNQPSSEAKSLGWARKRQRQVFLDRVASLMEMNLEEFETLQGDMELNKRSFALSDRMAFDYVNQLTTSKKLLMHFIDRLLGKPTYNLDDIAPEKTISGYSFDIVEVMWTPEDLERYHSKREHKNSSS